MWHCIWSLLSLSILPCHAWQDERRHMQYATNYQILNLPALEIDIVVEDVTINYKQMDLIKSDLNQATSHHLLNYTKNVIHDKTYSLPDVLEFRLEVGLYRMTSSWKYADTSKIASLNVQDKQYMRAEVVGSALTSYTSSGNDDFGLDKHNISNIVIDAFSGHEAMFQYLNLVKKQERLSTAKSIQVRINVKHGYEDEGFLRNPEIFDGDEDTKSGPNGETMASLILGGSLLFLLAAFYVHLSRVHRSRLHGHQRKGFDRGLLSDIESHGYDSYDVEHAAKDINQSQLKTFDEEFVLKDSYSFIPVPVREDEMGLHRGKNNIPKEIIPRRYVQPASPFDVLYGAAFSHKDHEKVEKAHASARSSRRSALSKKRSNKEMSLKTKPMMSISEGQEEIINEHKSDHASLPQIMTNMSSYLSKKRYSLAKALDLEQQKIGSCTEDDIVVYRDFPRHDGTPCIMFNAECDLASNDMSPPTGAFSTNSSDQQISSESSSVISSTSSGIDNFVDKLERLIEGRSRVYQERVKMEKESKERKKDLEKARESAKDVLHENVAKPIKNEQTKMVSHAEEKMQNEENVMDLEQTSDARQNEDSESGKM